MLTCYGYLLIQEESLQYILAIYIILYLHVGTYMYVRNSLFVSIYGQSKIYISDVRFNKLMKLRDFNYYKLLQFWCY